MNGDNGESADTCGCPASQDASPWDRKSAITNQVLMGAPVLVGTAALWRYRRRKLLVFLPAGTAFLTVWRRWTCARCQYYGTCLLYTSDAADDLLCVDLGGRR